MKIKRKKAYYSISAVSKMFEVHQQTIRLYEKQGLITPKRSSGNTRLFEEEDIDRLEEIIYLTHQLGINLAGVDMILKLKKQMAKMQKEMNSLFDTAQEGLLHEAETAHKIIQENTSRLNAMKSGSPQKTNLVVSLPTPDDSSYEEPTNLSQPIGTKKVKKKK